MKKFSILLISSLLFSFIGFSQNDTKALEVLNKASAAYNKAGGVKAAFTVKMLSKEGIAQKIVTGDICLKGSKFKVETDDMTTWFDGTNQWVYLKSNKEVNLSKPSAKELLMINPVNVFQLYKYGYNCKLLTDKADGGKKTLRVELRPANKGETIQTIVATFEKSHYRPISIAINKKDKSGSRISINTYVIGQTYSDALFTFQQKDYPNTEVIDLR
jgi:outer membrane lipoprotein-sorting protein